jgi:exosortase/archaeosortase family protein
MTDNLSVIILTYNEEKNIEACLESLIALKAEVFIVDSGSTDKTLDICSNHSVTVYNHPFTNYSEQRNWALNQLPLTGNWILNLDADHRITPELSNELLITFGKPISPEINGFLVSRKTLFMGKWIKYGGHYPTYHAILFRRGFGLCEEKLYDQHFKVSGKTLLLKNDIVDIITDSLNTFITRHNHWATLEAQYHFHKLNVDETKSKVIKAKFFGNPIERRRFIKKRYESFPPFVRPIIYYLIRYFIRLGFLDGPEGLIFHFLQGFWFRFLIDAKIYELNKANGEQRSKGAFNFLFRFLLLFLIFYYINICFFRITTPGIHYNPFVANYLNYIQGLRKLLLLATNGLLQLMGFSVVSNNFNLLIAGRGSIQVVYSCLGLGVNSFFAAFVLAYPQNIKVKIIFIITGILVLEILNVIRFALVALFWTKEDSKIIDHHDIFNLVIYFLLSITLYFWVRKSSKKNNSYEAN